MALNADFSYICIPSLLIKKIPTFLLRLPFAEDRRIFIYMSIYCVLSQFIDIYSQLFALWRYQLAGEGNAHILP